MVYCGSECVGEQCPPNVRWCARVVCGRARFAERPGSKLCELGAYQYISTCILMCISILVSVRPILLSADVARLIGAAAISGWRRLFAYKCMKLAKFEFVIACLNISESDYVSPDLNGHLMAVGRMPSIVRSTQTHLELTKSRPPRPQPSYSAPNDNLLMYIDF